jgi:putative ABC transport system substrate-binding protein
MQRRHFMTLLGGATAVWPLAAREQQPALPMIAFLNSASSKPYAPMVAAFHDGLKETGHIVPAAIIDRISVARACTGKALHERRV